MLPSGLGTHYPKLGAARLVLGQKRFIRQSGGSRLGEEPGKFCQGGGGDWIGPDLEVFHGMQAEGVADGDIGGIAAAGHQDASDARGIVARVEGEPLAAEIGFEPAGEIARSKGRLGADVAEVSGAVAGGNVHAAAEGDGQVGEVAADAAAFVERLPGRLGGIGELIAEDDVVVDEVADGLDARPAEGGMFEEIPGDVGEAIGFAIAAAEEENQDLGGQVLDKGLLGPEGDGIGGSGVGDETVGGDTNFSGGCDEAAATVAEAIVIKGNGKRRDGGERVGHDDAGGAGGMDVEHQHHGRGLRTIVDEFEADAESAHDADSSWSGRCG